MLFKRDRLWLINFVVAYKPGMHDAAIIDMKSVWEKLFPEYTFAYNEVEALYRNVYKTEFFASPSTPLFHVHLTIYLPLEITESFVVDCSAKD